MKHKRLCFGLLLIALVAALSLMKRTETAARLSSQATSSASITEAAINLSASDSRASTSDKATTKAAAQLRAAELQAKALGELGTKVLNQIPSISKIRELSEEEVHMVPKPIFEASLQLKLYGDKLEEALNAASVLGNTANVAAQGADFYEKCASREDAPESIRAVCFIEFSKFSAKSGHPENISRLHMPRDVLQIALEIAPSA